MFSGSEEALAKQVISKLRSYIGMREVEIFNPPKIVTLVAFDQKEVQYAVLARLDQRGASIRFAVPYEDKKYDLSDAETLYVIKEMEEGRDEGISRITVPLPGFIKNNRNIYQPVILTEISHFTQPDGKPAETALDMIVYPYVTGIRLDDYCSALVGNKLALEIILKLAVNICATGAHLEEYHQKLLAENNFSGMPGLWDIRADNMIVNGGNVVFIDYCQMRTNPHRNFAYMILSCLQHAAGINPRIATFKTSDQDCADALNANVYESVSSDLKNEVRELLKEFNTGKLTFADGEKKFQALLTQFGKRQKLEM